MATLVVIGYPDATTAHAAQQQAERLAGDLVIEPDAIALIVREPDGRFKVGTNHHAVGGGAMWGMLWGGLFGLLFFVPFLGMAVGSELGALMAKIEKNGVDEEFEAQARDLLQPGTSALFMVVEKVRPEKVVEALRPFGGTVLRSSLSKEDEQQLQEALHGEPAAA